MAYKIVFSEGAASQLEGINIASRNRIIKKLRSIAENPQRTFERLSGRKESKLRVGDYRLIAIIMHDEKVVFIIAIGHRREVYKRR